MLPPPSFIKLGKTTHLFGLSSTSPSLPPTAAVLSQLTVFLKSLRVLVASSDIQPKFLDCGWGAGCGVGVAGSSP